jgi:hypothetical protein
MGNSVNAFLVGRINVLGRINGGPLEAIEHACQTLEVDDILGAKLVARNKSYGGDNRGYVDTL